LGALPLGYLQLRVLSEGLPLSGSAVMKPPKPEALQLELGVAMSFWAMVRMGAYQEAARESYIPR